MSRWDTFEMFLAEAAAADTDDIRQILVHELLDKHTEWPWVEPGKATFIYVDKDISNAAVNLDTIDSDPPFAPMTQLSGTTLWYVTRELAADDLLDYMLAIDDPMTPLAEEQNIAARVAKHWHVDPRNPMQMATAQMTVSVARMTQARPFPNWATMERVIRGKVIEHEIGSAQLGFSGRKLWLYTPPGYTGSGYMYPLLILQDGQWAAGPLQTPFIADALIKHRRLQPLIIAMIQSGNQQERLREYVSNDKYYAFLMTEVLPFIQSQYRVDSTNLGLGGVAVGAIAAAHAALLNPAVFAHLMMISPPLGRGPHQEKLRAYQERFKNARVLPDRIFQSVGRYEMRGRFYNPAQGLRAVLGARDDVAYQYAEIGSGHGLVGFKSILPEALAWIFPGRAS